MTTEGVRDRETLYKLIISQLRYDGLDLIATSLAKCVGLEDLPLAPSSRLLEVVKLGLAEEKTGKEPELPNLPGLAVPVQLDDNGMDINMRAGLDLEYEKEDTLVSLHSATYKAKERQASYNGHLFENLGLLSRISTDMMETQEEYFSDTKLDFLCSLDLFPTPLIRKCPNATKQWLKCLPKDSSFTPYKDNTGINSNSFDESDYQNKANMAEFKLGYDGQTEFSHTSPQLDISKNTFSSIVSPSLLSPSESVSFIFQNTTKPQNNVQHTLCTTSQRNCDKASTGNATNRVYSPADMTTSVSLYDLVMKEVCDNHINQTIFAKAAIGKTQGYLSDILKHSENDSTCKNFKVQVHLSNIKKFLSRPIIQRKCIYKLYADVVSKTKSKGRAKQKRTVLTNDVKETLVCHYEARNGNITDVDLRVLAGHGTSPPIAQYETHYVTAHKGPVTSAAFTNDGRLCATGSVDTSIKIIDISRMLAKAAQSQAERQAERDEEHGGMKNHPVIRTMYDHDLAVNAIEFHPSTAVLISGGEDRKINMFDYTKSTVKKAYKCIGEVECVQDISIHPSGDYLLVATDHPTVRLYDLNTLQCFVSSNPADQHTAPLTSVKYCLAAHLYVTASKDGSWKLWDGVSNRCVQTYKNAHDGSEVTSVRFTKNSKFVLTAGRDSLAKLWELSTGRVINTYGGGLIHNNNLAPAVFNYTEDYVLFPDDKNMAIGCWDSRTSEKLSSLPSGHNNGIRHLVHSPCTPAFLSCSEDYRARFWYCRGS